MFLYQNRDMNRPSAYCTLMYCFLVSVLTSPNFITVSFTVYSPARRYLCIGLRSNETEKSPSPNRQSQNEGLPVDRSVNCTVRGAVPVRGIPEKSALSGESENAWEVTDGKERVERFSATPLGYPGKLPYQ